MGRKPFNPIVAVGPVNEAVPVSEATGVVEAFGEVAGSRRFLVKG